MCVAQVQVVGWVHLAALHQLLLCSRVLVGGGGVLSGSDGLSGCRRRLFGCVLTGNRKHVSTPGLCTTSYRYTTPFMLSEPHKARCTTRRYWNKPVEPGNVVYKLSFVGEYRVTEYTALYQTARVHNGLV